MDNPFYLKKKLGMRRSLIPFAKKPYVLHFHLTLEHKDRLYDLSREMGTSVDEVLMMIFDLGLLSEKDEKGRTDMVYYDPDMSCDDFYHALLVMGFARYDAVKRRFGDEVDDLSQANL